MERLTSKSPVRSWLQFHDLRESTASLWVSLYWSIWGMNQTTRSSRCFHFKILRSYFLQTQKDEFIYIWKFYSSLFYLQGKNLRESSLFGYKYLHILFKKRLSISVKKGKIASRWLIIFLLWDKFRVPFPLSMLLITKPKYNQSVNKYKHI